MDKNTLYQKKAHRYIPGGAHTYSRGDDGFSMNTPSVFLSGEGAYLKDLNGKKYLDYGMGLRSVTVGYSNKRIADAAYTQILNGNGLTKASKIEVDAAELICDRIPWVEMVKFAKNGSTVTTAAIKLARAITGKHKIARCRQHPFFSYDDWFIGDTVMNRGVPPEVSSFTVGFDYNDIESLKLLFDKYDGEIAAVIMEPATTVEPQKGYLNEVKELCRKCDAIFILDEMITGFRWHDQGASAYYGVEPDLVTYGKGMANGFSVAALGGRKDIMELGSIEHKDERVFLISTTHGAEMSGLGAFVETMKIYDEYKVVDHLWSYGETLQRSILKVAEELDIGQYFGIEGVPCSPSYYTKNSELESDLGFRTLFHQEMVKNGVIMPWISLSFAHGDKEMEYTLNAIRQSLVVYKKALDGGLDHYLEGRSIKPVFRKLN